jgi:hypothetical protein
LGLRREGPIRNILGEDHPLQELGRPFGAWLMDGHLLDKNPALSPLQPFPFPFRLVNHPVGGSPKVCISWEFHYLVIIPIQYV